MKDRPVLRSIINAIASGVLASLGIYFTFPAPPAPAPAPAPTTPAPTTPAPVPPAPPPVPKPTPNAPAAIARITFGSNGCTATIIGPRREDGRWFALTAAHCVNAVGQHGTLRLKDGRTTGVTVASINREADCCWLVTESNSEDFPFANLASKSADVGASIWHAGYGVHVPGNREDGTVEAAPDGNGQCRYRLSVSSGDSGGGICLNSSGEVLSPVCCTTAPGRTGQVWGASPEVCARSKPTTMVLDGWEPLAIPQRMPVAP